MEKNLATLTQQHGNVVEFITPSRFEVVIREQNGDDDSILSNITLMKSSTQINAFIRAIVVWAENGSNPDQSYNEADILRMRLGDKYAIVLRSRIFSLGPILKFPYKWEDKELDIHYEEELTKFLWDYANKVYPKKGDLDYNDDRIPSYPAPHTDEYVQLQLTSGKKLRFKYLNGVGEKYLLDLIEFEQNINSRLIARELDLFDNGVWVKVISFKPFKALEMMELRRIVEEMDPQFNGIINIENPRTGESQGISMIGLPDFFYPREI